MSEGGLTVSQIDAAAPEAREWEAYALAHRAGTVYHRLAWTRIFAAGMRYRSFLLLARSGGAVAGVLPLYLVPGLGGRRLVAVPFRDRGGPLWDGDEAFLALVGEAQRVARAERAGVLRLKSVEPYPAALAARAGLAESRYWVNSRVALAPYADGGLLEALGAKVRNMVRQAERQGLRVEVLEPDARGCAEWHALHLLTQRKLGLPPFPEAFFRAMFDELGPAGALRLCVARAGARAAAACLLLLHGRTAIYGYSASDPDLQGGRPSDLMLYTAMQWLAARGYEAFDLGSDAPSQEGLLFFKRKWLAVQAPIPAYAWGDADEAPPDSSAPRYALARTVLRRMPLAVLRALGARCVRYFG